MPTTKELIETLKQDPITLEGFKDPVLASDLGIYEEATYRQLRVSSAVSPMSRERFIEEPFPIKMDKYREFCVRPSVHTLLPIAICPITNLMMTNPAKVHLLHTDQSSGAQTHFAFVCDRSALRALPQNIKVVKAVDWDDLNNLIVNQRVPLAQYKAAQDLSLSSLEEEESGLASAASETSLAEKWEIALVTLDSSYTKTQRTEPTATRAAPPGVPPAAPYRGAFFQEEPPAAPTPPRGPRGPAPSSGG